MATGSAKKSPLQSDKGTTTIQPAVVTAVAAAAVGEVSGISPEVQGQRIPGDRSPTVGEFVDRLTGGGGRTRGISVEVGEQQAAVDLSVSVIYGNPIAEVTKNVRNSVIRRVEKLTGLEVTEVNITVKDMIVPEQ